MAASILTVGRNRSATGMRDPHTRLYAILFAVGAALAAVFPTILGFITDSQAYLGYQYNTDDHMVYSAWIRQAMEGRFFFDNRFTTDPQPGLTVNLYFYLLGFPARLIGIAATVTLARALLSGLFVWLAYLLICRLSPEVFVRKLALALVVLGGGIGYFVWHNYGVAVVRDSFPGASALTAGRLPIDVWQPEAFVFPSMLTNSLFMAALCLIVVAVRSVLDARESWKPVPWGFAAFFLLANVHTYDVALLGFVLVGFLAMGLVRNRVTVAWLLRSVVIVSGCIAPALWLSHVLKVDPVFQARAATETFSPSFHQVVLGLGLLIVFALFGLWHREGDDHRFDRRRRIGLGALAVGGLVLFVASRSHQDGYWLGLQTWIGLFVVAGVVLALIASQDDTKNLLWSWAIVGLVSLYFPALFQRKLAMGLAVPWAILGAVGLAAFIARRDRGARNVVTVLGIVVAAGSSFLWFSRERVLQNANVSNTTVHPVYLSTDATRIVRFLNEHVTDRTVVLAMPGIPDPGDAPDTFRSPLMPDLNPILTGLTGAYTYAGHWSETPDYGKRRNRLSSFFVVTDDGVEPREFLRETEADYIVAPVPEAFGGSAAGLRDMSPFGKVVVDGSQFRLIEVRR